MHDSDEGLGKAIADLDGITAGSPGEVRASG